MPDQDTMVRGLLIKTVVKTEREILELKKKKIENMAYLFSAATVTNYHKLCGLKQQN